MISALTGPRGILGIAVPRTRPLQRAALARRRGNASPPIGVAAAAPPSSSSEKPSSSSSAREQEREPPRRIIDTSRIGLKKQKALVQALRELSSSSSDSDSDGGGGSGGGSGGSSGKKAQKPPRKFRRPKATPEQREAQRAAEEERIARDAAFRGKSVALRGLYGTKGTSNPPCLLVDGYNVAHAWVQEATSPPSSSGVTRNLSPEERLRRQRAAESLDGARQALLLDLCEFSQVAKVKIVVAFDAMQNPNSKGLIAARVAGVDVVYCGDRDADAFLMAEARRLSSSHSASPSSSSSSSSSSPPRYSRVIVASSDREVQLGVDASMGCGFIGSELLLKEMRRASKVADAEYQVTAAKELAAAGGLSRSLRSEATRGLRALKEGLLEAADEELKKKKKVSKKKLKQ